MRAKRGFGRRVSPDDRDRAYLMRNVLPTAGVEPLPMRKTWRIDGRSLNQGRTGTCVGHAWKNFLRCAPMQTTTGPTAFDIYNAAILIDEWSDNDVDPDMQAGTSVRAAAQVVQGLHRLKSYLWAFSLQPAVEWVLLNGPVVLGVNWYSSFDVPDDEGIVRLTARARIEGGHAFLWRGVDQRRGLALCENSWGDDWGPVNGAFFIPLRDLSRLIDEEGEICTAVEQKVKAS